MGEDKAKKYRKARQMRNSIASIMRRTGKSFSQAKNDLVQVINKERDLQEKVDSGDLYYEAKERKINKERLNSLGSSEMDIINKHGGF